ncbi:TPA: hypothetical protein NJ458_002980 [Vibrio parahaemolyticus]|nr:hypothetical protein [Vibrio parahaemolyticus]
MSPFESWLFGYVASHIADQIRSVFGGNKLLRELRKTIDVWANDLPDNASLAASEALFPQAISLVDTDSTPALNKLRNKLHKTTIPESQDWHDALIEQWARVRENIDSPQAFFTISENEASNLISELSERLVTTCSVQQEYFNNTVVTLLKDLSTRTQGIDPNQLEPASESILHDIRNRELELARKKIEMLKNLGSLTHDCTGFLAALETKLAIINQEELPNKSTLVALLRRLPRDTYSYDLVSSILIHLDSKPNPSAARQFYCDSNHTDPNVQESFYEALAKTKEICDAFENSKTYYITEQELTGMVRGAYRQKDYKQAFKIAEFLNEQYPSCNSLVLLNLVESCSLLTQTNGVHFVYLDEAIKDRVMSIVSYLTSTISTNRNEVDKRHLAILAHLLQLTSYCIKALIDLTKDHLSLLKKAFPEFPLLINDDIVLETDSAFLLADNTLDEMKCAKLIEALSSGTIPLQAVCEWLDNGGQFRTGKGYMDEYLDLFLRTKLCEPKDRIRSEQIRKDVLMFLEKHVDEYRNINPFSLVELSEELQLLNLPSCAAMLIEPLLPLKPWLSPVYLCYLNALMASEKYKELKLRLNAIPDSKKTLEIWHMQACLNQRVGCLNDALTAAEQAVELGKKNAYSWFLRLAIARASGISVAEREQMVFCIPEDVFRHYSPEKQLLVNEIAMFVNPYLAERIMVDWFVQNPLEVAEPLTSTHFNIVQLQLENTEVNPYTPELCGDGVVYTDGFNEHKRLLVNTDASNKYPDFLSTQSGLGRAIQDLRVGESVDFQQFEYKLLSRTQSYIAAFQLALEIRIKNNDGTDPFWSIKMPENPAEIVATLERFMSRFDKNEPNDDVLNNPEIPLMMKGHYLQPSNPTLGAITTLTNPDICKSVGLFNQGDDAEKVVIDIYTVVYFALIGVGKVLAESSVEFFLTTETKAQLKQWLNQHSSDKYMSLNLTENGLKRCTADDIKRAAGSFISNLKQISEACSTQVLAVADTPDSLINIKDAFDFTVYSSLQLSIGNNIPLLSVDPHVSRLATALDMTVCNMFNIAMTLSNSLSQLERRRAITLNLFGGTPYPIRYDDVVWLCYSSNQDDIELVVRFLRKYGVEGYIKESNQTLDFITDIAGVVIARELEGKHLMRGCYTPDRTQLGYSEHVFYHCCQIAIRELDVEVSEYRLALFCVALIRKYTRTSNHYKQSELYASRITQLMMEFAQGHFLDCTELLNAFRDLFVVVRSRASL